MKLKPVIKIESIFRKGLLFGAVMTLVLLLRSQNRPPLRVPPLAAGPAGHPGRWDQPADQRQDQRWEQCRRLLRMGDARFAWESDGDQRLCGKKTWQVSDLRLRLEKLAKLRGRAARIVFLGDSRIRILHQSLTERLRLREPTPSNVPIIYSDVFHSKEKLRKAVPSHRVLQKLSAGCVEANVVKLEVVHCSRIATNDHIRSEFWWRPYLESRFQEQLDWLLSDCSLGRCPDIVVIDSGPWYAKIPPQFPGDRSVNRTTRFIAELSALQGRIVRLAALTKVFWKLDEPYMPEVMWGHKMNVTRAMMVLSSVTYEIATRMPEMTVWSSGIVEATQFYHQACRPHRNRLRVSMYDPVRYECMDPMHVGSTVRWKMLQSLFNMLLLNSTSPVKGLCCGS